MKWFKDLKPLYKAVIIATIVFVLLLVGLVVMSKTSKKKSDSSSESVKTPSSSVSSSDSTSDSSASDSSSDDTSSSDDSSKSSSDIKVSEKTIGRVEESSVPEKELTRDVEMDNNTDDDVALSTIAFKPYDDNSKYETKTIDIANITLADFCKKTGLEDSKLPKKTFKSKGFLFEGKCYVLYKDKEKTAFGSTLLVETDDNGKVKALCITEDLAREDFKVCLLGNIKLGNTREFVENKIGSGTTKTINKQKVSFYKNNKCTLAIVYNKENKVAEMYAIRNG